MAIARGTFTVGHGPKVAAQRKRQASCQKKLNLTKLTMDPETLSKGMEFLGRLGQ